MLEAHKFILIRNCLFISKSYLSDGLFVLNVIIIASTRNENVSSFAYIVESIDMWHGKLGHVNVASIKQLKELKLINTSESHENGKYPISVEKNFT